VDSDISALTLLTQEVNFSLVLADNAVGHGKSKTCAFTFGLGGKKWFENLLYIFW
jgi:hypothetical protein